MYQFPIGVIVDSFRLPLEEAVAAAARLGVQGMQMYATYGATSPEEMDAAKRRELRKIVVAITQLLLAVSCTKRYGKIPQQLAKITVDQKDRAIQQRLQIGARARRAEQRVKSPVQRGKNFGDGRAEAIDL